MLAPGDLRKLLNETLRTSADFDAYCRENFPKTWQRMSDGMDRLAKTNLLLELAEEASVLDALRRYDATDFKKLALQLGIPVGPEAPEAAPEPLSVARVTNSQRKRFFYASGGLVLMTAFVGVVGASVETSIPTDMALQSGGVFTLSEPYKDARQVLPYLLDRTEVTRQDFLVWLRTRPGVHPSHEGVRDTDGILLLEVAEDAPKLAETDLFPVTRVTYLGATRYCLAHDKRLPRYEEWDLAARGAEKLHDYPWGDARPTCIGVIFGRNATRGGEFAACGAAGAQGPAIVGTAILDHNEAGIHDLAGNVSEWVQSPTVPYARGGSWARDEQSCKTAYYVKLDPQHGYSDVGFRCAKDHSRRWWTR